MLAMIALSFAMQSAPAQEQPESLALIDQKISALKKESKDFGASEKYFQNVRTLLDFIYKADVKISDQFDRRLVVASQAMSLRAGPGIHPVILIEEKRSIALSLLGAPLKDVNDPVLYAKLRERYSKVVVDFIVALKKDRIVGYQYKPVFINGSMDLSDNDATRSEKIKRFNTENNANNESNEYQESLKNEVPLLELEVIDFLKTHYGQPPSDQKELKRFLKLLSK